MKIITIICIFFFSFFICNKSHAWFWTDERKSACGSVEWEFQNAFECMSYPHMWQRWNEIADIYGVDAEERLGIEGCPIFIRKLEKYNLTSDEKLMFIYLTKSDRDAGLIYKYKEFEGVKFCDAAEINGWIDDYLKTKAN